MFTVLLLIYTTTTWKRTTYTTKRNYRKHKWNNAVQMVCFVFQVLWFQQQQTLCPIKLQNSLWLGHKIDAFTTGGLKNLENAVVVSALVPDVLNTYQPSPEWKFEQDTFNQVFAACRAKNRGLEQAHHVPFSLIPRIMCERLGMRLGYDIWGKCLGRVSLVIFSRHYLPNVGSTTDQPRNNYFTT